MKILYGVQGTGNGHITRARVMQKELSRSGIQVDWVFSGRPDNNYFDMDCFGNYRTYRGLTFVINNGKINHLKTASQLHFRQLWKDINSLDLSQYDLVLNDFDPVTAWAAKKQKVTAIGLSHQNAFHYNIPKKNNNLITDLVMKWFAPVSLPIGVHWHHFNSLIMPPIIETSPSVDKDPNHILVYFPFQSLENLITLVKPFSNYQFYIYHDVKEPIDDGHIHIRPFSRTGFHKDLQATAGVICGAGFELPSEALQLGKKLLVQPVAGQMEQTSNALALQQLNLATACNSFNHEVLSQWLSNNGAGDSNYRVYPNTAKAVVDWLTTLPKSHTNSFNVSELKHSLEPLVESLWQQCGEKKSVNRCRNSDTAPQGSPST